METIATLIPPIGWQLLWMLISPIALIATTYVFTLIVGPFTNDNSQDVKSNISAISVLGRAQESSCVSGHCDTSACS